MALTVALVGLKGGVGRTTLTANLAGALSQAGRRPLAIDLDPRNDLRLHYGGLESPVGIATERIDAELLARRSGAAELGYMPFGRLDPQELRAAEERLATDSGWLSERVAAVSAGCEVVLIDTPAYPALWLARAIALADLVCVVVTPDPACYATLPATQTLIRRVRGPDAAPAVTRYLVNRFDSTRPLARDVLASLRRTTGEQVLPTAIQDDEIVREALGHRQTVFCEMTTDSQAVADLAEVGEWLAGREELRRMPDRDAPAAAAAAG